MPTVPSVASLKRLPFHERLVSFLKEQEPDTWSWFAKRKDDPDEQQAIRRELLKQNVRLDAEDAPSLYEQVERAAQRLELSTEVRLYRAQQFDKLNCSVVCLPDSCHIVLHGPVEEVLDADELLALIGHELGHAALWLQDEGALLIADQILAAWSHEPQATSSWAETSRLFRLYAEIFCDRTALLACDELHAAIGALVKLETGAKNVRPASYLKQAEEIVSGASDTSRGESHPETYVRALALKWWAEDEPDMDARIVELIEGRPELTALSLIGQSAWQDWTRDFVAHLLQPDWRRSDLVAAHARQFFDGAQMGDPTRSLDELDREIVDASDSLKDFACYLLLDFATCDREQQEVALAQGLQWSRRWDYHRRFCDIVRRELRMRKSQVDALENQADALLNSAHRQAAEEAAAKESAK